MGIPKFFLWMSERYPLCYQLIENSIYPEFDNLYLDVNGVIHNCSRSNQEGSATTAIPDQILFPKIFEYIETLFNNVKPKKVFFIAIDGVAPRAKMNQQRARRFTTAAESEVNLQKAVNEGVVSGKSDIFDSNCITPGTVFMEKLTVFLKYFLAQKVSEDREWQNVQVILSGHEVPGEGEHKIMEFMRKAKAQPDYDPNTRHCLYGQDADLIVLGLVTHEPHMAILREEIIYGDRRKDDTAPPKDTPPRFLLYHLQLLREYLELDFLDVQREVRFPFSIERVIDDFVLIIMLLGNDFVPHLVDLHISKQGMLFLFAAYKTILPTLSGYLTENGIINLPNFTAFLNGLRVYDFVADKEKISTHPLFRNPKATEKHFPTYITPAQCALLDVIYKFVSQRDQPRITLNDSDPDNRTFIKEAGLNLGLKIGVDTNQPDRPLTLQLPFPPYDSTKVAEFAASIVPVFIRYQSLLEEASDAPVKRLEPNRIVNKKYYKSKMGWDYREDSPQVRTMVYHYVKIMQWALHYYYHGLVSWSYFYPYHYAPMLSDIHDLEDLKLTFDENKPFLPFQQLMGVLPAYSRDLLPAAYHDLFTDSESPIIDFYPSAFRTDLNGKRQSYEAVVLIPFIESKRLLTAMKAREHLLSAAEKRRNRFAENLLFVPAAKKQPPYPSPMPEFFPDLTENRCRLVDQHNPPVGEDRRLVSGLCPGALTGNRMLPGFPSLYSLPHHWKIEKVGVKVSNLKSSRDGIVIYLNDCQLEKHSSPQEIASRLISRTVLIDWPYLTQAKVVSVHDDHNVYTISPSAEGKGKVVALPMTDRDRNTIRSKVRNNVGQMTHRGLVVKKWQLVLGVVRMMGMREDEQGWLRREYAPLDQMEFVPLKATIHQYRNKDHRFAERPFYQKERWLPVGESVFFLAPAFYGQSAKILKSKNHLLTLGMSVYRQPTEARYLQFQTDLNQFGHRFTTQEEFHDAMAVVDALRIPYNVLRRLCSNFIMTLPDGREFDIGLRFCGPADNTAAAGYARHIDNIWQFSTRAINLVKLYQAACPRLFKRLTAMPQDTQVSAFDIFGDKITGADVTALIEFIRGLNLDCLIYLDAEGDNFLPEAAIALEQGLDAFLQDHHAYNDKQQAKDISVANVPRPAVLEPGEASRRLDQQTFELGDRVVNLTPNMAVPFGARGFVVSISDQFLGLILDAPFPLGTNLNGLCSAKRGYMLHKRHLLNVTNPQFVRRGQKEPQTDNAPPTQAAAKKYGTPGKKTSAAPKPKSVAHPMVPPSPVKPTAPAAITPISASASSSTLVPNPAPTKTKPKRKSSAPKPKSNLPAATPAPAPSHPADKAAPSGNVNPTSQLTNSLLNQFKAMKIQKEPTNPNSPAAGKSRVEEANAALAQALLGSRQPPKQA
ncbi:exonuclease II Exo2 [Dimargaris cristalligena]|nr:exonuclease II Exo2 [Dimargaris cristalligena]